MCGARGVRTASCVRQGELEQRVERDNMELEYKVLRVERQSRESFNGQRNGQSELSITSKVTDYKNNINRNRSGLIIYEKNNQIIHITITRYL